MIFKSDKLDYLRCPRKEFFFDNFFSIEQGPSNVWKLNWDLLSFFFIHIQSHLGCGKYRKIDVNKTFEMQNGDGNRPPLGFDDLNELGNP